MKRLLGFMAFFFVAIAAQAQDVDFGAFADPGSLLGPTAPAARGATPPRGAVPAPAAPDRFVRLRDALAKTDAPLTKEQETELNKLLDAEIPAMRRTLQTHGQQMIAARGAIPTSAAPPPPPVAAQNPALAAVIAARGAAPSSRVPAEVLDALEVEARQLNDVLFTKLASSPTLNPAQQSVLTKMARAQIRSRGGYEALRITMEDAAAPFTQEQIPKVQALFEEQKAARSALAKESQGTPDPAALKQLDRETLTKVLGLLTATQRTALLGVLRAQ
jgi:hypothetical protein